MNTEPSTQTDPVIHIKSAAVSQLILFFLIFGLAVFCYRSGGNPGLWLCVVLVNTLFVYILREAEEWMAMSISTITLSGSCIALFGTLLSFKYTHSTTNIGLALAWAGIAFILRTQGYIKVANAAITVCGIWFTAFAISQTIGASTVGYVFEIILWIAATACWLPIKKVSPHLAQVGAICSMTPAFYFASALCHRLLYSS